MNRRSRFAYLSAAAIAALLYSGNHNSNVQARDLNWDSDAESGMLGFDGSGSWDLVTSNWVDGGLISGTNVVWSNSPADSATFGTTTTTLAGVIPNNIDLSAPITVQNLTLAQDVTGAIYNFSDFGGGPLTIQGNVNKSAQNGFITWLLGNNGGLVLDTGSHTFAMHDSPGDTAPELTINGAISGPGNLVMDNGAYDSFGSLAINVDSTYTGTTTINKGRLIITKPNALGSSAATSGTIINNQGTLSIGGGGTTGLTSMTINEPITITRDTYTGTDFTQYPYAVIKNNGSGDVTFAGTITLASTDARIASSTGTLTITNDLVASVPGAVLGLTGDFAGYVQLLGNNTAALSTGGIKLISAVELQAFNQNQIGGPSSPLTFAGDATLGIMNGFMTDFGTHVVNYSSFSGGLDIPTGFSFNLNTAITGGNGLGKRGGGTLNVNAGITGTGSIFWDAGTVNINAPVSLGSIHLRSPVVNIGTGGSLTTTAGFDSFGSDSTATNGGPDMAVVNLTGNGQLIQNTGDDFNISDNASTTGTINMSGNSVLTTGGITFLGKSTGAVGTINQNGGTVTINRTGNFGLVLGDGRNSQGPIGIYGMSGTSVLTCKGEMYVGEGHNGATHGTGFFTMSGGTVNLSNWFVIGREGGVGTVDISGGIFNHTGGNTSIGDSAGGTNQMTIRGSGQYLSTAGEFWVGTGGGSVGTLIMQDNAVLAVTDWFPVGRSGALGTLDISGNATVTKTGGNNSYVGESNTTVTSTMTVRGNGKFTASSGEFWVGQGGGSGILTVQDNAGFTVNNWFAIGRQGNSKGIVNFSGGTMTKTLGSGGFLAVGSGGSSATFNQTGGTLSIDGTRLAEASNGTMNISGGTSSFTGEFSIGTQGTLFGTMNLSGTANVTAPNVVFGANGTTSGGIVNLNAGATLTATSIRAGNATTAGNKTLFFNGGLLKPSADDTNFMGAKVTGVVSSGGALIDSNNRTVTINSPVTHDGALGGADGGLTKSGSGTVTLAGAVLSYTGPTSVTAGKLSLANNLTTSSSVTLSNNALAEIVPNGSSTRIVKTGGVTITGTAKLNIQDNKLISTAVGATGSWTGSNYTGITGLIAKGRGTGNLWDGTTGIITTQSLAVGSNYTSIGVARASDVRPATATATDLWGGQTITGTDTLVMYTYGGDATLDGKINIDDYVKIDSGISAGLTGWSNGDFNYDGKVSIDDYITVIDANIGNQSGVFPTAGGFDGGGGSVSGGPSGVSAVPEPAGASLLALGAVSLLGRRRRRKIAAEI